MNNKKMFEKRHFIKKLLVALFLLGGSLPVFSQVDTAFWFAVPKLAHTHQHWPIVLVVSAFEEGANVTVHKAYTNTQVGNPLTVQANSSATMTLVSDELGLTGFECEHNTTSNYGLYIHSTKKINAYVALQANNSEIYGLKGSNGLGTKFFIPMQYQYTTGNGNMNDSYYGTCRNAIEIIATENNTTVHITPSVQCGTHPANQEFTITLQKGQVYCLASNSQAANAHLDGTIVISDKPIAVDVSDDSVWPGGSSTNFDLVGDQIVPEDLAGSEYVVFPSPSGAGNTNGSSGLSDYAFIFALEDNTDVTICQQNGVDVNFLGMMRGDKQKYHFTSNSPIYIKSYKFDPDDGHRIDYKITVFQLTGAGNELGGTQLPQINCTGSTSVTYRPLAHPGESSQHPKHLYLNLLCQSTDVGGFLINNNPIPANVWNTVPGHTMKYCQYDITSLATSNSIRVTNTLGKFHMGMVDYHQPGQTPGQESYDDCSISYFSSYTPGSSVAWDPTVTFSDYCQGDIIQFGFDTVDANITRVLGPNNYEIDTEPFQLTNALPENSGWYTVVAADSRECLPPMYDSIEIVVHPTVDTVVYDTICPGVEYSGYEYFQYSAENTQMIGTLRDTMELHTEGFGCDSLLILELFIRQDGVQQVVYDTICPGEEYFGYQQFHIPSENTVMPGTLTDSVHLSTVNSGCDSLLVLQLTVRDSVFGEFSHTACNQYTWNGHTYRESGDYQQFLEDVHGCDSLVTLHLEVEEPSVEIVTSGDDFCEFGELVLTAVSDYEEYHWSTGDTTPFISVDRPQTLYTVTVTQGDCEASAKYETPDCPLNIFIPNAITPSQLDGKNDYLCLPEYVHRFISDFDIEIYNRWGELVFRSNDMNFRWYGYFDGNGKRTRVHVSDVYVYIMHYERIGEQGKKYVKKGTVTVL